MKPILAGTVTNEGLDSLRYPLLMSPKLDGIRALKYEGKVVSRNLKPIRNAFVQRLYADVPDGVDGELIVGSTTAKNVFQRTTEGVMSADGEPVVRWYVFDDWSRPHWALNRRQSALTQLARTFERVSFVSHIIANEPDHVRSYERRMVTAGYEGIMLRALHGEYKYGRSTLKEQLLLKLKRWKDAEATVVDFVEQMRNDNVATRDALGRTKRSSSKLNKTGKNTLGALVCVTADGVKFEIGTGFDDATRAAIWNSRQLPLSRVKYKYQDLTPDGVPRFPVFLGFRDKDDLP